MLINAMISITMALVFYTIGVWGEKIQGSLKKWHIVIFWMGLIFDTLGTKLMGDMVGGFTFGFHAVTGLLAIVLMLFHAVWATRVLIRNKPQQLKSFHKFSVFVWLIWLIPYLSGAVFGMVN